MSTNPHSIKIYIDGSVPQNPGREGGIHGWVEYPDDMNLDSHEIFQIPFDKTTNNRMELRACIMALGWIKENKEIIRGKNVEIYSDSAEYVVKHQWNASKWRHQHWRGADGQPIKNWQLWKEFLSKRDTGVNVSIKYLKGKSTKTVKMVDKKAKQAAGFSMKKRDYGYVPGKASRTKIEGVAQLFPATGQEIVIRIYSSTLVNTPGRKEHEIKFEVLSKKLEPTSKYRAYVMPKEKQQMKTNCCYRVRLNKKKMYPQIEEVIGEIAYPNK